MASPPQLAQVKVDQILSSYGEFVAENTSLEDIYTNESKLTIDNNKLVGVSKIVEFLKKEKHDFKANSYSMMLYNDNSIIVSGDCIWGNSPRTFTFVFQEKDRKIAIINQMIF